jgi:hypothetical protein
MLTHFASLSPFHHAREYQAGSFVSNDLRLLPHTLIQPDLTFRMEGTEFYLRSIGTSQHTTADETPFISLRLSHQNLVLRYLVIGLPAIAEVEGEGMREQCVCWCAVLQMVGCFPLFSILSHSAIHLTVSNSVTYSATPRGTLIPPNDNASNFSQLERTGLIANSNSGMPVLRDWGWCGDGNRPLLHLSLCGAALYSPQSLR